jgi:glycine/D-amino acid oxidase-like deaminating enzyme
VIHLLDLLGTSPSNLYPNDGGRTEMASTRTQAPKKPKTVAIVGAGISGLKAADILLAAGVDVKIFEARDRIGGRVHQIECGGHLVDVGANWIHDTDGNPLVDIAKRTHSELFWRPGASAIVGSDGRTRSPIITTWLGKSLNAIMAQAYDYSAKHSDEIDPGESLMDFVHEKAWSAYRGAPDYLQDLLNEAERFGLFIGERTSRQSLKFLTYEEGPGGTDAFNASTYREILGYIASRAAKAGVIHMGKEVTKITYDTFGDVKGVIVITADGMKETFDEVVITCPLGWLKQHQKAVFTPSLPRALSVAIDNVG